MIQRVDRWESKSIKKIKQVAKTIRHELKELFDRSKKNIEDSLRRITKELQENRRTDAFTETDLANWTHQLQQLRNKLENPPMIKIQHDEEEASSTHLPLIQLRVIKQHRGK